MKLFKLFLLLFFSTTLLFSASVPRITKVEIKKGELRLQFDQAYSKNKIRAFTLHNPTRKVFDIKNARLAKRSVGRNLRSSHCRSIRVSQYRRDVVRIVIEVSKPYKCEAYKPMFSYKSYRIPLPKYKSTGRSIYASKSVSAPKKQKRSVKKPAKKRSSPAKKQHYIEAVPFVMPAVDGSPKHESIVIDAGHGGHDSGAVGGGKKEKDLVLQIAKRLEKELKRRGYRVYMTRKDDRFLKLTQRTKIADRKNAKVFISIHANSVPKRKRNKIHGVETFFLQTTRDAKSQRIAARENKAVLKGAGSQLSKTVIIDSVLNGPKIIESNKLAIDVQRRMLTNLHKYYKGVSDGGVRHAPFWVLVGASRPSILVEVGYISHPKERKRLFTAKYQKLLAKGIAEGVDNYLINRKKEIEF